MRRFISTLAVALLCVGAVSARSAQAAPAGPAKDAGCSIMVDLSKELDKLGGGGKLPTQPKAVAKVFSDAAVKIKSYEGKAPAKLRNDFVTMRAVLEKAAALVAKSDPKKPADLTAALKILNEKPINDATNRLDKYAASCGIK